MFNSQLKTKNLIFLRIIYDQHLMDNVISLLTQLSDSQVRLNLNPSYPKLALDF